MGVTNLPLSIALYCLQAEKIDRHRSPSIKKTSISIGMIFHYRSSSIEIFPVTCPMPVMMPPKAIVLTP